MAINTGENHRIGAQRKRSHVMNNPTVVRNNATIQRVKLSNDIGESHINNSVSDLIPKQVLFPRQ